MSFLAYKSCMKNGWFQERIRENVVGRPEERMHRRLGIVRKDRTYDAEAEVDEEVGDAEGDCRL